MGERDASALRTRRGAAAQPTTVLTIMSTRTILPIAATTLLIATMLAWRAPVRAIAPDVEHQMTGAGVTAVEDHWNRAEIEGDTTYLDQLLVPDYRSVNPDGSVHPKLAIIAGARDSSMTMHRYRTGNR